MPINNHSICAALLVAGAMTLSACDRQATEQARRDAVDAGHKINNALERTGEKIADASRKAAAEVKEAGRDMKESASTTTADARSSDSGRVMSDVGITASIKTDYLKDPDLSVLKIDVDTRDGVVTLNGLAPSSEARQRAEKLAAANKGVKQVRNFLTLKQG